MQQVHIVPDQLKEKLKADFTQVGQLKEQLKAQEGYVKEREDSLQNLIGAYILGAQLPPTDIKFNDEFNILYEDGLTENTSYEEVAPEVPQQKMNPGPVRLPQQQVKK